MEICAFQVLLVSIAICYYRECYYRYTVVVRPYSSSCCCCRQRYCSSSSINIVVFTGGGKHHEIVSLGERRAMRYVKDDPQCLLRHNYRQMARIYPTGARFDSSNYDPVPLWNAGCQLGK